MEVVWSKSADRDLARIYAYLEPRSQSAVRRLLRRLFKTIDGLAEMPRMGSAVDLGMTKEYRQQVVGHYKIYYFIQEESLIIVRLWDTRQDPTKFFLPREP